MGRFQNLDYMHSEFVHFTGDGFGFNLGIDSNTKYFLLSGYVIQLLKIQFVTLGLQLKIITEMICKYPFRTSRSGQTD